MDINNIEDEITKLNFSYAVVIRGTTEQIINIKKLLEQNNITIVYQKLSANKLYIKEE